MTDGVINIRGKQYQTVAKRVADFRKVYPLWSIETSVRDDEDKVVAKCTIRDESGRTIATGHAEEYRASSSINKTSALENAETSAVGRALAFLGLGGDYGIASADEVLRAVQVQGSSDTESALTMSAAMEGGDVLIKQIEKLVADAKSTNPGAALAALAKTKGAVAWRDLSEGELGKLYSALAGRDTDDRKTFLDAWASK